MVVTTKMVRKLDNALFDDDDDDDDDDDGNINLQS